MNLDERALAFGGEATVFIVTRNSKVTNLPASSDIQGADGLIDERRDINRIRKATMIIGEETRLIT